MPVLGFSALMLRPGETVRPAPRSSSAVLHVIEGAMEAEIDGVALKAGQSDTISVPTHAKMALSNTSSKAAYLFQVDDAPLQRKLGFHEVRH